MPMLDPSHVSDPSRHVCLILRPDGREDIYRPGSWMFGSLAPIPSELARRFAGTIPARPLDRVFRTLPDGRVTPVRGVRILGVFPQ